MKDIQVFENEEFGSIRTVEIDGMPWFVGKDVTKILGYQNSSKALKDHVYEEDKLNNDSLLSLGQRGGWLINESGLYSLIISSKLPNARGFKRWITSEILPAIRRHGFYATEKTLDEMINNSEVAEKLMRKLQEERLYRKKGEQRLENLLAEKQEIITELVGKAEYFDNVLASERLIPMTLISKDYGLSAMRMNAILYGFGIQYKVSNTWVLYEKYQNCGYTRTQTLFPNGSEHHSVQMMYWTETGRQFIYDFLKERGILPNSEFRLQQQLKF